MPCLIFTVGVNSVPWQEAPQDQRQHAAGTQRLAFELRLGRQMHRDRQALAARDAVQSQIDFGLPAAKATAEAALAEAQVALDQTLVVAGTDGIVQQFALRAGDVVNPMLRPAGILVPDRHVTGLVAGRYFIIGVAGLEDGAWFDPDVLSRLLATATPITLADSQRVTLTLVRR